MSVKNFQIFAKLHRANVEMRKYQQVQGLLMGSASATLFEDVNLA